MLFPTRSSFVVLIFGVSAVLNLSAETSLAESKRVREKPVKVVTDNKNTLLKKYQGKLKCSASTFYQGWEPKKVIDGNVKTSWFTATGDAAAKGTKPWVQITFPTDVTVRRVTVLGNREPAWFEGYTIISGLITFLDADGKVLWADENKGVGNRRDFDFRPKKPIAKVRSIRFSSLKDQGDKNPYDDIAIAEIQAE